MRGAATGHLTRAKPLRNWARTATLTAGVCEGGQAGHNAGHPHRPWGHCKAALAALCCFKELLLGAVVGDVGEVGGRERIDLLARDAVRPLLQQLVALRVTVGASVPDLLSRPPLKWPGASGSLGKRQQA